MTLATAVAPEFEASAQASDPLEPCARYRVLVVDDDEAIRHLFHTLISRSIPGCEVDRVTNGAEAVEAFAEKHHAVVLMDLHMPVMDGRTAFFELERACGRMRWEMPAVLFCTGYAPPDAVTRVVRASERHALLAKPVDPRALIDAVRRRLD